MDASLLALSRRDMEAAMPLPTNDALAPATSSCAAAPCGQSASGSAKNQAAQGFGGLVQEILARTAGEVPAVRAPLQLASADDVPGGAGGTHSPKKNSGSQARNPSTVNTSLASLAAFFATSGVTSSL